MPDEPEVHGLLGLMQIHHARRRARFAGDEIVLLEDQDRSLWDVDQIADGRAALERALSLRGRGPYVLQAAIASLQAEEQIDWDEVAALYGQLARITRSPVVELNRAVAVGMAFGPAAGLELVDALMAEPALQAYHFLPAARGDLLLKLGRLDEAHVEFQRAASLTQNARERTLLLQRAEACSHSVPL
jgi:predicted RNA polymerase sigma factor